MGQSRLLHSCVALASPWHSLPPYLGAGSLQRRSRVWTPPPQVTVQVSHRDQGPQLPLTAGTKGPRHQHMRNSRMDMVSSVHGLRRSPTYLGSVASGTSPSPCPSPHSPCHPSVGSASCIGGYGWWRPPHTSPSTRTRETSGSSCHPAWLVSWQAREGNLKACGKRNKAIVAGAERGIKTRPGHSHLLSHSW